MVLLIQLIMNRMGLPIAALANERRTCQWERGEVSEGGPMVLRWISTS
jgi:hypothetical protein